MQSRKTHADRLGITTGVTGETVKGVLIGTGTQVSGFVKDTDIDGLKELLSERHEKYRRVSVPAVVFGLHQADGSIKYALYANYNPQG